MIRYYAGDRIAMDSTGDQGGMPTGYMNGAILNALDTKKQYLMSGNVWGEVAPIIFRENYWITGAGISASTLLGIPNGRIYATGTTQLQVYFNGIYQRRNESNISNDYSETNATGISFNYAIPTGAHINFVIMR